MSKFKGPVRLQVVHPKSTDFTKNPIATGQKRIERGLHQLKRIRQSSKTF